jgi:hypothetical protein
MNGRVYYTAIYNVAFDATRVSQHYSVLTADDDAPAVSASNAPLMTMGLGR